jgi:polar amino acid transport system substrate-binding protein
MYSLKKRLGFIFVFFCLLVANTNVYSAEKKLIIVGEGFAPFEFTQDGKVVGIDIDIAKYIFNKMNIPVEFRIQPWKRAWYNVETGKADAILSTSLKEKRKPYLLYPQENMWVSEYVFFVMKDKVQPNFAGYKTAIQQKLTIGIINGNSYHPSFWQAFPYKNGATKFHGDLVSVQLNEQLDGVNKFEQNLKKLVRGRIDLVIADKTVGLYTAKLLGLHDQITYYDIALYSKPYPMPFAKKSSYPNIEKIANQFEQELKALKQSGKYQSFFDKWLK